MADKLPPDFYTTRVTVEFVVHTQFGPKDAVKLIEVANRMPAISKTTIKKVESNFRVHQPPSDVFVEVPQD